MADLDVVIQTAAFDPGELQQQLIGQSTDIGGVVTFTGYVRNANEGDEVSVLQLDPRERCAALAITGGAGCASSG